MALTALMILDGFGYSSTYEGNAIREQGIPNIQALLDKYPNELIHASGLDVGLPDGQMGNSEVGHLNIGAGRIVYQELTRITKSIRDGDFFEKEEFLAAAAHAKKNNTKLHVMGLVSDGGVHSHNEHLYALVRLAQQQGLDNVYIHCFLDGRDVAPDSGAGFLVQLEQKLEQYKFGTVATVMGRYWSMDRDNRWDRVQRAYDAMVLGKGATAPDSATAIQQSYDKKELDEFVQPTVIEKDGKPVATIEAGDAVIFFNFRPDRAREITRSLISSDFDQFPREGGHKEVFFVSMTQYDATFQNLKVAYKPQSLSNTLGEYLAANGKTQLRIAETEKYAHVTFFFNGGVEEPNKGEDRCLIPSPKVATYDLKPEMSAYEVADEAVARIRSGKYDVMILNFANCDMVGHTGVEAAAIAAVSAVDTCVEKVISAILEVGGRALITADHGNAEKMRDTDGSPFTAHTSNPVPLILVDNERKNAKLKDAGRLADLAPTLLYLLGLPKPEEMTGENLIIEK